MTTNTVRLPTNAAAEEVRRLRSVNLDLDEQMRTLRETQMNNSELIGLLSGSATWEEVELPVEGEGEETESNPPAPEPVEPEPGEGLEEVPEATEEPEEPGTIDQEEPGGNQT